MPGEAFSVRQARGDVSAEVRKLQKDARKRIRSEVKKILTAETKTVRAAIKQSAKDNLPKRGGLNLWAAVTPTVTAALFDGDTARAGISMKKSGHDLAALNDGTFRHPVYGHRKTWISQQIEPGFFTAATTDTELSARISTAILKSLDNL